MVLLPFSSEAKALSYEIKSKTFQPADFDGLRIVTKDLHLKINLDEAGKNWDELLIVFLNRVTELGHFERLNFLLVR